MGGQAGVSDHLQVGAGARVGAQGGVIKSIKASETVWGTPARDMKRVLKEQAAVGRLPELLRQVKDQERRIRELEKRLSELAGDKEI